MRVRAIVWISGHAAHPDTLHKLHEVADENLMIVPKDDPLFHPKLYLFDGGGTMTRRAWVGSANLYEEGFGDYHTANEEMMLEVGAVRPIPLPLGSKNSGLGSKNGGIAVP